MSVMDGMNLMMYLIGCALFEIDKEHSDKLKILSL